MTLLTTGEDTRALWMLNTLMVERAVSGQTGGALTIHEQWVTPAGNPPPHVHRDHDEAFLVLAGELEVTVGGESAILPAGGFAYGPRGVPHGYRVHEGEVHLVVVTTPGGVEHFFREIGEPAAALLLPEPTAPDVARVVDVAARHGITILPPE